MEAISANEPAIQKVPRTETMKPYTTDAGPPFRYALANRALVASHVQRLVAAMPRTA